MMESQHIEELRLQELAIAGELPTAAERGHLVTCADCRSAISAYQSVYGAVKSTVAVTLPADFADLVMAKLPQAKPEGRFSWVWIPGFVAASTALMLGVGFAFPDAPGFGTAAELAKSFWQGATGAVSEIGSMGLVWGIAGVAIAGFAVLDHILRRKGTSQQA